MSLDLITGVLATARRVLFYGTHGIGKSTFAAKAPDAVFIDTEGGLDNIDCKRFPRAESFVDVLQQCEKLIKEKHKFKWLAIDTLDWCQQLVYRRVCELAGKDSIEDFAYGKGYTQALDQWQLLIDVLERLRSERQVNVLLISHAQITKHYPPDVESYDRYEPRLHKHASALWQEWCDEVLFASYKVLTRSEDQGFGNKRAKAIGGERVIRCTEKPAWLAKNRLSMPDEIRWGFEHYAEHIGKTDEADDVF